jgi:hypothetical protein
LHQIIESPDQESPQEESPEQIQEAFKTDEDRVNDVTPTTNEIPSSE